MADAYLAAVNEDGSKSYKAYAGDLSNAKVVIEKYGKDNFKYLKEQIADIKKYDSRANINMCYELNLNKKAETDKYITYNCSSYAYLAGAHGSSFDQSFNIIKATGKLLTETVDTTQVKKLQPILRKGVISYLNEYNKEDPVTDKNLASSHCQPIHLSSPTMAFISPISSMRLVRMPWASWSLRFLIQKSSHT